MAGVFSRLRESLTHAWNAFNPNSYKVPEHPYAAGVGAGGSYSYFRPDRMRTPFASEKTIVASILARMSIDVSGVDIFHVQCDADGRYLKDRPSGLNNCLTVEANTDQGARQFRQDIALSLLQMGTIGIVPVDTTLDPTVSGAFDVQTLRVGEITEWFPKHVRINLYNEEKGYREQIVLPKQFVAIVENPLYSVMNEQNSTLQRLIRKLNMLDAIDEASASGKLDLIIQLPYVIKSEARRQQAVQRRTDLEEQLKGSTYGIAYADGTEKITQLNRPAENNLLAQVQYLISQVYAELGLTDSIMNGTADESTMLNYIDRTVKPILDAITEAMKRAFLTRTARSQGQSIMYFRDLFSLVPLSQIAEIADMFSRNEILTPNEIRTAIGTKPSSDPKADKLQNSNMPVTTTPPESNKPVRIEPVHNVPPIGSKAAAALASGSPGQPPSLSHGASIVALMMKELPRVTEPLAIESGGKSQNGS